MAGRLRIVVAIALGVAVMAALTGLRVTFRSFINRSGGMLPTVGVNERVLTRRASSAKRGEIIAFRYPIDRKTIFLKRVVALAGETVEIRDKQLFVNGWAVNEPYVIHEDPALFPSDRETPEPYRHRDQYGPSIVPPDSYFVLGDNRDRSSDSRFWGAVPRRNVIAVAILAYSVRGSRWLK